MSKRESGPQDYVIYIPTPRPVLAHHCSACGYDPCIVYENNFVVGHDDTQRIEQKGQLCKPCAESSASYLARNYPHVISWRVK